MTSFKTKLRILSQATISFTLALLLILPVNAIDFSNENEMLDFFYQNGIYYYNPTGSSITCVSGSGKNYSGATVFNETTLTVIETNRPIYEEAAAEYNMPWQILAVIHSVETSLKLENPPNGQGIYQLKSYAEKNPGAFPPKDSISEKEFIEQTKIAAEQIATGYGAGLDLTQDNDVKKFFFRYNGTSERYIQKALAMGFSQEAAERGEGSPYVMNRFDGERDPSNKITMNKNWPGMWLDSGYDEDYEWLGFGAYTKYVALGGTGACSGLVTGGMNFEQAYNLVKTYVDDPQECLTYSTMCDIYDEAPGKGEIGANCVTFVQYFLRKYTSVEVGGLPNGRYVVGTLTSGTYSFTYGGSTPRPYAIFSRSTSVAKCKNKQTGEEESCGHTGVVLGIDEPNNIILIGQLSYGNLRTWGLSVIEQPLNEYTDSIYTYAYTDEFLTMGSN